MKRFSEHIWYRQEDPVTDLPYCYYINGSRFSLAVDAGNSPENYRKFLGNLASERLREPTMLVLTHWHYDHTFGLPAVTCPVIASEKAQENLLRIINWEWTEKAMRQRLASGESLQFAYDKLHIAYPDVTKIQTGLADILFDTEMNIDLGGVHVRLVHRDTPHTRDAVLVFAEEDEALIGGDSHDVDYYDNDGRFDPGRLDDYVKYLEESSFRYYLKGHDGAVIGRNELLAALREGKTLPGSLTSEREGL